MEDDKIMFVIKRVYWNLTQASEAWKSFKQDMEVESPGITKNIPETNVPSNISVATAPIDTLGNNSNIVTPMKNHGGQPKQKKQKTQAIVNPYAKKLDTSKLKSHIDFNKISQQLQNLKFKMYLNYWHIGTKVIVSLDMLNIQDRTIQLEDAKSMWLFKPRFFEKLSLESSWESSLGETIFNMLALPRRHKPFGQSETLEHADRNSADRTYAHEILVTFVNRDPKKTLDAQVQAILSEIVQFASDPTCQGLLKMMSQNMEKYYAPINDSKQKSNVENF
jgi:hypothetical protein